MDIANAKITRAENNQDNGTSLPPLTDTLVATDEPPLHPWVEASNDTCLASMAYNREVRLKAAGDALFNV